MPLKTTGSRHEAPFLRPDQVYLELEVGDLPFAGGAP